MRRLFNLRLPNLKIVEVLFVTLRKTIWTLSSLKESSHSGLGRKFGNLGNLGNLGNIIPSFLISKFSILPYSQNRKLGLKNLGKKFPSFPRFPSFRPGQTFRSVLLKSILKLLVNSLKNICEWIQFQRSCRVSACNLLKANSFKDNFQEFC